MQFTHTWQQILSGQKTQTRRIIAPGDMDWGSIGSSRISMVDGGNHYRTKWEVGKTYAVQPGRGKAAVGRIKITAIRRERLQDITEANAKAEGCLPSASTQNVGGLMPYKPARFWFAKLWNEVHPKAPDNWDSNPAVWVLTFELVRD